MNSLPALSEKFKRIGFIKSGHKKPLAIVLLLISIPVTAILYKNIFAAGDVSQSWNFANSGDYTLSDSSLIEVTSNLARLKTRNYTSDANTSLLLHFDESSGTTADDSSSNNNDGTLINASFVSGNLNNAVDFNGTNSKASVPDSSSISFSQQNTLEAWVKFDTAFDNDSHDERQAIFDKGSYQLYFDYHDGKIKYALADSTATTVVQRAGNDINGSWDINGKTTVNASTEMDGDIYVGLGAAVGDAAVWKWDGSTWTKIGGDGVNGSWPDQVYEEVTSVRGVDGILYAGLSVTAGDAEVWSWNGSTWTKIGGDGINSGWIVNTYERVRDMTSIGTTLYAALGSTANDAEVWSWNGSAWTKIGGDSINSGWTTNYEDVYALATDGTLVYAGLALTAGDAEVWSWNGSAWTKIGGDGINSSWADATYEYVQTITAFGGNVYVGLGITANDAEVWRWNGSSWTQIGGDSLNSSWGAGYEGVYSLTNDGTNLYAGLGATAGDNEVWSWNGTSWTKIGGDAVNSGFTNTHLYVGTLLYADSVLYAGLSSTAAAGEVWSYSGGSWSIIGGNYINDSWGFYNLQSVESFANSGEKLYAGTGYTVAGNAMVFEFDGSTWNIIGGQGINGSWNSRTYEIVNTMVYFRGSLYVGLGVTANEAEVWRWDGNTWTQIGGDSLNSGWTTNYENVTALAVNDGVLYAGLGSSANDAEVWSWNGSAWTKIGGDSINSGWTTNFELITSLAIYDGALHVGLGLTAGDAEVWRWSGSSWTRIGGDATNSSWANTTYEYVYSMTVYDGELYAGLGTTTGEAEVWKWNGSAWSQIGGDSLNSSWTDGEYESVRSMAVYNGELYAGTGSTSGDGEVWKYNGSTWTKIAGDSLNDGWTNVVEDVPAMNVYKGKLYMGTGLTANADATVWSYGNNSILESTTDSFDTNWHHIAATYDGITMKLYIDGVLDNSATTAISLPDNTKALLIGSMYGSRDNGISQGFFEGLIDEVRLSNDDRTSFNATAYSAEAQTISNSAAVFTEDIASYAGFIADETLNGGSITFRLSDDNGSTWKYWNGSSWVASASLAQSNTESDVNTNITSFPVTTSGIKWQAILDGDGTQQVTLNEVTVEANSDTDNPSAPNAVSALNESGGVIALVTNTWYTYTNPYFSWTGAADGGSGIAGYYVYFGTDNTATPSTAGSFQAAANYTANGLTSGQTYYLRIQTRDNAQNISPVYEAFIYKLDTTSPTNPSLITVTPSGYASTNDFTFSWPSSGGGIATDVGSGVAGYQYKTGAASGPLSDWSSTTTSTNINIPDAAYQTDANVFYLRTLDNAGNVSSTPLQVNYYFAGEGPSAPQFLTATPNTNTTNSFAFSWQAPSSHSGDASDLTYCYTVNTLPSSSSCTFTSAGATSLSASSFATQVGTNTFYVSARNPEDSGGAINYGTYASVTFTANTSAPGIPLGIEISDVSIKSSNAWRLALSWTEPTDVGSGVSNYQIYRSTDDSTYTYLSTTSGAAYIDTGLTQQTYYYKVKACDNVDNCGVFTEAVSLLPTGKFTEAAVLESEPEVLNITTKKATIKWSTDRASDTKVSYGADSDDYFDEEPSNSDQTTAHEISLSNLNPGTKYFATAKWTDEDGNTGMSDEFEFTTLPAPTVTDPKVKSVGINSAILTFTVEGASKAIIYYGETSAFGGTFEVSTSSSEATYTVTLDDLKDATKYFYKINTEDVEGAEYEGNTLSFDTLPRPRIASVRVQQVVGTAQPSVLVTWDTNTETSSVLTYYPASNPGDARDLVDTKLVKGKHQMLVRGLFPETPYSLIVRGIDIAGNEAASDVNTFTTSTDTRAPFISELNIEGSVVGNRNDDSEEGSVNSAQIVVSWNTDEPSTSQVEYGEGTGTTYSQKTTEDKNLTINHLVVISGLSPSKVYHLRVISNDKAGNESKSIDKVTITPKSTDNALDLVIKNLSDIFGFLRQ